MRTLRRKQRSVTPFSPHLHIIPTPSSRAELTLNQEVFYGRT